MRDRRGFSLLELLAVLAVLAVLVGLLLAVLGPARERARRAELQRFIQALELAVKDFQLHYNRLPWPAPEEGAPWDLTAERELPAETVFKALAPRNPLLHGNDDDGAGGRLNPEDRTYLEVPRKFVRAGGGLVVDLWDRPLRLWWDPNDAALVVISSGANGENETLSPEGRFLPKPYGDDLNNR
ncbi:MAG: prepilin-type N-terminal cleavage/methylation domain-containing protein [Planctomycetota bacterium]|nr:prepilin-type N-terminal cleavage/methylation domain-containing protein [Planctomycetota bacterium]